MKTRLRQIVDINKYNIKKPAVIYISNLYLSDNTIKQAKKRGYAIAIGHPHDSTFEALKIAKQTILKDVDVVYLKDIYGLYN